MVCLKWGGMSETLVFLMAAFRNQPTAGFPEKTARPHPRSDPGESGQHKSRLGILSESPGIGVYRRNGTVWNPIVDTCCEISEGSRSCLPLAEPHAWMGRPSDLEQRGDLKFRSFGYCDRLLDFLHRLSVYKFNVEPQGQFPKGLAKNRKRSYSRAQETAASFWPLRRSPSWPQGALGHVHFVGICRFELGGSPGML